MADDQEDKEQTITQKFTSEDMNELQGYQTDLNTFPCLVLIKGDPAYVGKQWILDGPHHMLGRNNSANIHIEESSLSKNHAEFTKKGSKIFLTDLDSTNNTKVGGEKLKPKKPHELREDTDIIVGALKFKFFRNGILTESAEKERMQKELDTAKQIQASIFPRQNEAQFQNLKICGKMTSASEVSGDWWWYWSVRDKAYTIIADAVGHGASAAMITASASSAVKSISDNPEVNIVGVYNTLADNLAKNGNDKWSLATFIVEVDFKANKWSYINAGHPYAALLPTENPPNVWQELDILYKHVSPLMGTEESAPEVGTHEIQKDMRLFLATDGFVERKNLDGKQPRTRDLGNMVVEAHKKFPTDQSQFLDYLQQLSEKYSDSGALEDDITLVALDFV